MPARTVVIEKLSKWNGETHADITPGEYTQLTGRAGRRGLDVEGHGVVLWQPGHGAQAGGRPRLDPHLSAAVVVPAVVQHGRQPGAPVRPGALPGAAGAVVRAVPGRQGGRRPGPPAPQGGGRAGGVRRGRDLPPGRLHGVRPAAAPDRRRGEGGEPVPEVRPARRGAGLADQAAARGRDRRTRREVLRAGRGGRSGHVRRQPAPVRRHRRSAGATPGGRRLPDPGRAAHPAADPEELQRPQPADASRPGLGAARPHPRPDPAADAASGARRRPVRRTRQIARLRAELRAHPCHGCATARTTPAGPSAGSSSTATPPRCGGGSSVVPTPSPGSSTASATC